MRRLHEVEGRHPHRPASAGEVVEMVLQTVLRGLVEAELLARVVKKDGRRRLHVTHGRVGLVGAHGRGGVEDHAEPDQLVDQADDRAGRRGQTGRTVRRGQERGAQPGDRGVGPSHGGLDVLTLLAVHARDLRGEACRQLPTGVRRSVAQGLAAGCRPQQRDGGQRHHSGEEPAEHPVRDDGRPGRCGDGEDEAQQDGGGGSGEGRADHAGEQHQETHDEHRGRRQPGIARDQGGDRDQDAADGDQ